MLQVNPGVVPSCLHVFKKILHALKKKKKKKKKKATWPIAVAVVNHNLFLSSYLPFREEKVLVQKRELWAIRAKERLTNFGPWALLTASKQFPDCLSDH